MGSLSVGNVGGQDFRKLHWVLGFWEMHVVLSPSSANDLMNVAILHFFIL